MTTLRDVLDTVERMGWEVLGANDEGVNARDYAAECSHHELAQEVSWVDRDVRLISPAGSVISSEPLLRVGKCERRR